MPRMIVLRGLGLAVFVFVLTVKDATSSEAEERLYEFLFARYNKQVRPVLLENEAVNVTFGLSLNQVIDVDEKNQILTISAWIRQIWGNPLLSWDPAKFNGITSINISPKVVWLPDIVLYNNADEDKSFGGNMDRMNTRIILNHNGKNMWLAPIILKSKCPINVRYFPFDEQRCPLKFGSWTYDGFRLNLMAEGASADLGKYLRNSEWHLDGVPAKRHQILYFCCPEPYYDVTFTLIMKRRSLFYLTNLIFPMVIIGMLTIMAFLLPAESGERVSLAITLLLSMTVFMLVVADIIPPTSEVVPLVGIFFSAAMIEMVIMILVLCYTLRLYHKTAADGPMPLWMRRYVLDWLSYKLRIRKREKPSRYKPNSENGRYMAVRYSANGTPVTYTDRRGTDDEPWSKLSTNNSGEVTKDDVPLVPLAENPYHGQMLINRGNHQNSNQCKCQAETVKHLNTITEKINGDQADEKMKSEWRIVAKTVDQCLLITFLLVVFLTTLVCFFQAPGYVP